MPRFFRIAFIILLTCLLYNKLHAETPINVIENDTELEELVEESFYMGMMEKEARRALNPQTEEDFYLTRRLLYKVNYHMKKYKYPYQVEIKLRDTLTQIIQLWEKENDQERIQEIH